MFVVATINAAADFLGAGVSISIGDFDDDIERMTHGGEIDDEPFSISRASSPVKGKSQCRNAFRQNNPRLLTCRRGPMVTITVPEEIIAVSKVRSSSHCMVAEAVRLAVPDAKSIAVDLQTIRWTDEGRELRYIYLTPRVAQVALIDFDQGKTPEPFSFRLRAAQVARMTHRHSSKAKPRHDLSKGVEPAAPAKAMASRNEAPARKRVELTGEVRGGVEVLEITGGKPPPKFAYRREFGIKGFSR
jgi:hypothetical protein